MASSESYYRKTKPLLFANFTGIAIGKATIAVYREQRGLEPAKTVLGDRNYHAVYDPEWLDKNAIPIYLKCVEAHERKARRKDSASRRADADATWASADSQPRPGA